MPLEAPSAQAMMDMFASGRSRTSETLRMIGKPSEKLKAMLNSGGRHINVNSQKHYSMKLSEGCREKYVRRIAFEDGYTSPQIYE